MSTDIWHAIHWDSEEWDITHPHACPYENTTDLLGETYREYTCQTGDAFNNLFPCELEDLDRQKMYRMRAWSSWSDYDGEHDCGVDIEVIPDVIVSAELMEAGEAA